MGAITPEAAGADANPLGKGNRSSSPEAVEVDDRRRKRGGGSSGSLRAKFRIESLRAEIRTLERENEALVRMLAEIRRDRDDGPPLRDLRLDDGDGDGARAPRRVRFRGDGGSGSGCTRGRDEGDDDLRADGGRRGTER